MNIRLSFYTIFLLFLGLYIGMSSHVNAAVASNKKKHMIAWVPEKAGIILKKTKLAAAKRNKNFVSVRLDDEEDAYIIVLDLKTGAI